VKFPLFFTITKWITFGKYLATMVKRGVSYGMNCKQLYYGIMMMVFCFMQIPVTSAAQADSVRLTWPLSADAVTYELEITDQYFPAGNTAAPESHRIEDSTVPTPGAQIPLHFKQNVDKLWWRVRALDVSGQPITDYSESQRLSKGEMDAESPLPLTTYPDDAAVPLYPAYSWIAVPGATGYDVEILNVPLDDTENSWPRQRIERIHVDGGDSFDSYDWHSYATDGTYYWRVRAVDSEGQSIGKWSPVTAFTVSTQGYSVAALGDSITHGGGAVSSPPGTPLYDWTQSVTLPVKNLGKSGDTTEALLERFDQDVLPFHPKILIIAGGINDIRDGDDASQIISNLRALRQKCLDFHITPVFVTLAPINPPRIAIMIGQPLPPQWKNNWQAVNGWILAQPNAVDTVSLLKNRQGLLPDRLSADGLHPDSEGKRLIGQAVSRKLYELQYLLQ
jgi:lysophospholipase L1-like esterase